jgi:hypothetical protein
MTLDDSHRQDLIQHKLEKANETIADVCNSRVFVTLFVVTLRPRSGLKALVEP